MKRLLGTALFAALIVAPVASADPPPWSNPHYPDYTQGHCEGGSGGFIWFWCDGAHYPDGTYWHQPFEQGMNARYGETPVCLLDGQPAPAGGCDGAVKASAAETGAA